MAATQTATQTRTLTTADALALWSGLVALLRLRLPAVTRYRLDRTRKDLLPLGEAYEAARLALVAEHVVHKDGKPQENETGHWRFETVEAEAAFVAELKELLAQPADVRLWPVAPSDLGAAELGPECDGLFGVVVVDPADAPAPEASAPDVSAPDVSADTGAARSSTE